MENRGPGAHRKEGDTGHLDICQPLMKEFNLVENLKQPCLTGGLTEFSSLCRRVAAVSMCYSARGQSITSSCGVRALTCVSQGFFPRRPHYVT